jgi:iron-sulfur cluster insertion protein
MTDTVVEDRPKSFQLTENAAKRIRVLAAKEGVAVKLRLAVTGGGCSGFQYNFSFDEAITPEDRSFERDGATVIIDETSLELLAGSELDFVEDLVGAAFQVKNPNATSKCGCGSSFSV